MFYYNSLESLLFFKILVNLNIFVQPLKCFFSILFHVVPFDWT